MADIAGLEPVSCGFKSRSPYPNKSSDSSTDRMLGYEPGDVGSIPPLTTISRFICATGPRAIRPSSPRHSSPCPRVTVPACPLAAPPRSDQLINRSTPAPILDTLNSILSSLPGP